MRSTRVLTPTATRLRQCRSEQPPVRRQRKRSSLFHPVAAVLHRNPLHVQKCRSSPPPRMGADADARSHTPWAAVNSRLRSSPPLMPNEISVAAVDAADVRNSHILEPPVQPQNCTGGFSFISGAPLFQADNYRSFCAKSASASEILICCGQTASQLRQPMQAAGCFSSGTAINAIGAINPPPVKQCSL